MMSSVITLRLNRRMGVLQRFTLLQPNFCQTHHPQASTISDILELTPSVRRSVVRTAKITSRSDGVGMRPSVAITITHLGLTLGKMRTALTVDRAFDIL